MKNALDVGKAVFGRQELGSQQHQVDRVEVGEFFHPGEVEHFLGVHFQV